MKHCIFLFLSVFFLVSCNHISSLSNANSYSRMEDLVALKPLPKTTKSPASVDSDTKKSEEKEVLQPELPKPEEAKSETTVESVSHTQDKIFTDKNHKFVDRWIKYFQTRGRERMETYLSRSSRYLPIMKEILKEHNLPEELVYVAMIESGFSPRARSFANAVGYWQFIEGTAKRYGLKVDSYVDERRDPILSTQAAARYFQDLYNLFGSWDLALASYNAGEYRVNRAVMRHYTRDFWYLSSKRSFPRETINYVPKFIAAVRIGKNPGKYGFEEINYQDLFQYDTFLLKSSISLKKLAGKMNMDYEEMRRLNPAYRGEYVPVNAKSVIRVPVGKMEEVSAVIAQCEMKKPHYVHADYRWYRVRRGDTLSHLARRNRTTISTIRRMNRMTPKTILRAGRRIKLPYYNRVVKKAKRALASLHTVRSGESLTAIAKKYKIKVHRLKKLNGLTKNLIHPGQVLHLLEKKKSVKATGNLLHIVQKGETLIGIAKQYNVSLPSLMKLNSLNFKSILMVGTRLMIPM